LWATDADDLEKRRGACREELQARVLQQYPNYFFLRISFCSIVKDSFAASDQLAVSRVC
jgi:hypothetical protein